MASTSLQRSYEYVKRMTEEELSQPAIHCFRCKIGIEKGRQCTTHPAFLHMEYLKLLHLRLEDLNCDGTESLCYYCGLRMQALLETNARMKVTEHNIKKLEDKEPKTKEVEEMYLNELEKLRMFGELQAFRMEKHSTDETPAILKTAFKNFAGEMQVATQKVDVKLQLLKSSKANELVEGSVNRNGGDESGSDLLAEGDFQILHGSDDEATDGKNMEKSQVLGESSRVHKKRSNKWRREGICNVTAVKRHLYSKQFKELMNNTMGRPRDEDFHLEIRL